MDLIELAFPAAASEETRARARALCEALGKTAVEVPDTAGFVVNRLLFPYLFEAVRLMERTGLEAEAIDTCMRLGAGHPLGPMALLDLVGLDVSAAIGRTIGAEIPERIEQMIEEGALGRKAGRGFYTYDEAEPVRPQEPQAGGLPRRRPRDRVGEPHRADALVRRHALGDEGDQLPARRSPRAHHDRDRHLAVALVGPRRPPRTRRPRGACRAAPRARPARPAAR